MNDLGPQPAPPNESPGIPPWFVRVSRVSWGFVGIVVALGLIVLGLGALREVFIPLVMAAFFAAVFAPGVDWLERRRIPRSLGSVLMIVAITAVLVGAVAIVVVAVVDQVDELSERFDDAQTELETIIEDSQFNDLVDRIRENVGDGGAVARDGVGSAVGTFLDSASGFASGLVLGIVLLYYLLKDGSSLINSFVSSRSSANSAQYQRIISQAGGSIRSYFKGKTWLALVQGIFVTVVLALMGVPLAGSVGVVNFIGAYIPFIGAFIGGAFAMLMALSEGGLALALVALGVVVFMNVVLENVLEPKLLGSSLDMHPIVILLATFAGGLIAGLVGLILAAPLTAIGKNLYQELKLSGFFSDETPGTSATGDVASPDPDPTNGAPT